jgi:predicted MFS family arabinose efflux permease
VLSGLQTVVQLHAPAAYRGRVLSFYLVALGIAYPIGALAQGPLADHVGVAWTTVTAALALSVVYVLVAWRSPRFVGAMLAREPSEEAQHEEPAFPAGQTAEC